MNGSDKEIMATIQCVLSQANKFVKIFLRSGELIRNQEVINARLAIHEFPEVHLRTHIRQTCKESAAISLENVRDERDIILHQLGGGLQRTATRSLRIFHCTSFVVPTW
jgi:hypothetical protein